MKATTLAQLGEDALVQRLTRGLPLASDVVTGAGDDCAIVKPLGKGWVQLLKTDCVVEGIHFTRDTAPQRAGRKAMARTISDIGAMGGEPQHALVTLLCPSDRKVAEVEKLYAGIRKGAAEFGVSIVGGETSRAPLLAIVISLTGRVRQAHCARRSGAKAGDVIYVTGRLGGSLAKHHLDFTPRVKEGQWLAGRQEVHAMMDLSDGLAKDLPRIATASGVEFVIEERNLPCSKGCSPERAWGDGEDYELLLAVAPQRAAVLETQWARQFPRLGLTKIGSFVAKGRGKVVSFFSKGWEHFRQETT